MGELCNLTSSFPYSIATCRPGSQGIRRNCAIKTEIQTAMIENERLPSSSPSFDSKEIRAWVSNGSRQMLYEGLCGSPRVFEKPVYLLSSIEASSEGNHSGFLFFYSLPSLHILQTRNQVGSDSSTIDWTTFAGGLDHCAFIRLHAWIQHSLVLPLASKQLTW